MALALNETSLGGFWTEEEDNLTWGFQDFLWLFVGRKGYVGREQGRHRGPHGEAAASPGLDQAGGSGGHETW